MRHSAALFAAIALTSLGVGFGAGRLAAPGPAEDLATLDSFRAALEEPDWLTRSYRFSGFLLGLSPENLPGALEAIEDHLPWLRTEELRVFMLAWARFDPAGALDRAMGWPEPFHRNGAGAAIYAWAMHQPAAAQIAVASVADPELREFMEGRMLAGWTHGAFKQGASDYIASMPEGPRRFRYMGMLAWELSKQGPEVVHRWAEAVPDGNPTYKAAVFLKAASTLAAIDPPGTARWLAGHLGRPYADDVMRVVARSWALQEPEAALAWLGRLPAGRQRDASVTNAFSVWHRSQPEAAEQWLRRETPSPAFDPALLLLIRETRAAAPDAARAWADALADPSQRRVLAEPREPAGEATSAEGTSLP